MTNNNNNEEKKGSAVKRFFGMPGLLKIDFDKPVPFRQQFAIMGTVLVISAFLFTGVYAYQMFAGNVVSAENKTQTVDSKPASQKVTDETSKKTETPEVSGKTETTEKITKVSSAQKDIFKKMTTVVKNQNDVYNGSLILVNKEYPSRLDGENIKLLYEVENNSYVLGDYSVGIAEESIKDFNSMLDDFASIYGQTDIMVACGYRSKETQESLRDSENSMSDEAEAEQWVAPPGYSEHQTGYAFDFDLNLTDGGISGINYDGQGDYAWLNSNCGQYGFIVRYRKDRENITGYKYEPWHFRYVGFPHSQYIEDHDITLEEYHAFLHKHTADNAIIMEDRDGDKWCIYYVPASGSGSTDIPVPEDRTFEISGDNMVNDNTEGSGGFIVTVSLKEEDVPENVKELKADQEASIEVSLTEEESEATEQSDETQDVQYTEEESQDDQNIYDYQTYDNNDYTDDDNGYDNNDEYNYSENYYQDDDETGGDDEYNTDGYYEETYE